MMNKELNNVGMKYVIQHFEGLEQLSTKDIGITLIPKHATTNLVRFFIGEDKDTDTVEKKVSKYSRLFRQGAYNISDQKPLIVITRNERERWSSGIVQELNEYDKTFKKQGWRKSSNVDVQNFLNDLLFAKTNRWSHLLSGIIHSRITPVWLHWMPALMQKDNVYFTDLSCLKTISFWTKVCLMDPNFPPVIEWFDDWMSLYMGNHPEKLEQYNNTKVANMVNKDILTRKELNFISETLDRNQTILDYLKTTDRWLQ